MVRRRFSFLFQLSRFPEDAAALSIFSRSLENADETFILSSFSFCFGFTNFFADYRKLPRGEFANVIEPNGNAIRVYSLNKNKRSTVRNLKLAETL